MPAMKDVNPSANTIADYFLKEGGIAQLHLGQMPQMLHRKVPATDPGAPVSSVVSIALPDEAKVDPSGIVSVYVRAVSGGSVLGYYVEKSTTPFTTPTTGTYASQPNGNIMLLAADLPTDVDVTYIPQRGKIITLDAQPVASDSFAIPSVFTATPNPNSPGMPGGVIALLEVFSLAGTLTGQLRVKAPNASAPATTLANLDLAKQHVLFAVADAVTSCRVKLLVCPDVDLQTVLQAPSLIL